MSDKGLRGYTPITTEDDVPAPKGWRWALLTDVAKLESGHTPSRRHPEWWGGDVPWIALPDIRALDGREAQQTTETINDLGLANSSARLLPRGTVAMSRTASIGFVTVMGRPMATSQDFVNWVCSSAVDPWFLAHALIRSRDYLRSISAGAIHKTIYMPTLKSLRIALPPLREQGRITRSIDAALAQQSGARAAVGRALAEVKNLTERLENEMFTFAGKPVAMSEIISDTRNGIYKQSHFYGRGIPILKMFNIGRFTNEIITDQLDHLEITDIEHDKWQLREGDILVNRVNSRELVGKCAYIRSHCAGFMYESKNLRLTINSDRADPLYVSTWLNSPGGRRQIEERLKQIAGMATISRPDLDALSIPLPSIPEQRRRFQVHEQQLESRKMTTAALTAQLAAINALPGALLAAAFRGEL